MKTKNIFNLFLITVMVMATATMGFAQQGRGKGRIRGTVADTAGNPIPDVKIMVEHIQYGTKFQGKSDKKGGWAIAGLGTGNFRITAEKEGYSHVYHEIRVSQFFRNNPPVNFTMQKVQDIGVPAIALFEEGNQLFDKEKYAEALAKYQEFLVQNPAVYQVTLNIGEILFKKGEADKGIEFFEKAIKIKSDWPPPYRQRGYAYLNMANYQMAVESFRKFIELAPDDPMAPTITALIPKLEEMIKK